MHISISDKSNSLEIRISGELNIRDCEELAEKIKESKLSDAPLTIDVSDIRKIDIANIQLLIAATRSSTATSNSISVSGMDGSAFHDEVRRAGLEHAFPNCGTL